MIKLKCRLGLSSLYASILFFLLISCNTFNNEDEQRPLSPILENVRDQSYLQKTKVSVARPITIEKLASFIGANSGKISIAGGKYSMGGQTFMPNTTQVDMRGLNSIKIDKERKLLTVEAGAIWREVIEKLDKDNLSVKVMQSYANFTVGGALSVNCHGRYIGHGAIISTVKEIKLVLADGAIKTASPIENKELFYAAIGGYGAIGVIVEATLELADNVKVEKVSQNMAIEEYWNFFKDQIQPNLDIIFHNANINLFDFRTVESISFIKTDKQLTITDRIAPPYQTSLIQRFLVTALTQLHTNLFSIVRNRVLPNDSETVKMRNHEATQDVSSLEPLYRTFSTFLLQEYFIPVDKAPDFVNKMREILKDAPRMLNVSIRHAKKDPGSYMAWAREGEVFAFVLYYKQFRPNYFTEETKAWTSKLIDAALGLEGTYYLPYQIFGTQDQFEKGYPGHKELFKLKKKHDPDTKFSNQLWDKYYDSTKS